ncbi:hypothetical protein AcW2_004685 [Taiwanofungus camphoratus]|nr:hypothetical protein AcW2_004685 [Antrodia cinnamomea]
MVRHELWEKVQAVLSSPATKNLRWYLSQATLPTMSLNVSAPPMPPLGHKSHENTLSVIPNEYRVLEVMHCIKDPFFTETVLEFLDDHVPSHPLDADNEDESTGEAISIPCYPQYNITRKSLGKPANAARVAKWVAEYPLETVQRIMHLLFPITANYSFDSENRMEVDEEIFRHITWSPTATVTPSVDKQSITVVIQPPWILSPKDLELFATCRSLPRESLPDGHPPALRYVSKERLWAKLWDVCFRRKSHWFVVTTYWGWVFGAFSKGWTRGFVSDVKTSDQKRPTVAECLVYWFGSAVGIPGGWEIPEVPEPVDSIGLEVRSSIPPPPRRRISVAPSNSEWDINSDAYMSDADTAVNDDEEVIRILIPTGEHTVPSLPIKNPYAPKQDATIKIRQWQMGVNRQINATLEGPARSPSPAFSQASISTESSASTVRDYADQFVPRGVWLSGNPRETRYDYQ